MDEARATSSFLALSNSTRLQILKTLVRAGPSGMLAGNIAEAIGATPSRTSFHLSTMSECGLIQSQRTSRQISYAVDFKAVGNLMKYLLQDCCDNNATALACCTGDDCC